MVSSSKALSCAHRVVIRTAVLSLLMTALPSSAFGTAMFSAFAASTGHTFKPRQQLRHPLSVPLLMRGGQQSARNMSINDNNDATTMQQQLLHAKRIPALRCSPTSLLLCQSRKWQSLVARMGMSTLVFGELKQLRNSAKASRMIVTKIIQIVEATEIQSTCSDNN